MFTTPLVPPKRYRIGEIVAHTGLSRQTIHNYTKDGLIQAIERTEGGHRLYGEDVFARLQQIRELKSQDISMADIRDRLVESAVCDPENAIQSSVRPGISS